jgi:hypothetical protein
MSSAWIFKRLEYRLALDRRTSHSYAAALAKCAATQVVVEGLHVNAVFAHTLPRQGQSKGRNKPKVISKYKPCRNS